MPPVDAAPATVEEAATGGVDEHAVTIVATAMPNKVRNDKCIRSRILPTPPTPETDDGGDLPARQRVPG